MRNGDDKRMRSKSCSESRGEKDASSPRFESKDGGERSEMKQSREGNKGGIGDDEKDTGKGLERTLTLTNGVTIIVGCIIGSGIFVGPTGIQEAAGSVGASLIMWILCGIWCGLGAYLYAELGTLITKSGGDYAYIMEAFGPFIAFLRLWIEAIVVRPTSITIISITFAIYILRPFYPTCEPPSGVTELLAGLLIVVLGALNCWSVRLAAGFQDWTTYAKVIALVLVIITGAVLLLFGGPQYRESFENIFEGNFRSFHYASVGFYTGLFAYQGWTFLNYITEELINPKRNLPLAIMFAMSICTVVYTLFNVALYTVISPDEMLISPAVAVLFADKMYGKFSFIMPLCVAASTVGSANGAILTSSRLFFCGARKGQMPVLLTMINKRLRTPIPAVVFTVRRNALQGAPRCFLSIVYLLMSSNLYVLINASQVTAWLGITVVSLALIRLRWLYPDAERPVKVNFLLVIIFVIGSSAIVILPIFGSPLDTALGLAIMLTAVPIYVLFIGMDVVPNFIRKAFESMTIFFQKLFMVLDDTDYNKD